MCFREFGPFGGAVLLWDFVNSDRCGAGSRDHPRATPPPYKRSQRPRDLHLPAFGDQRTGCAAVVLRRPVITVGPTAYVWWKKMGARERERTKKKGCDWMT